MTDFEGAGQDHGIVILGLSLLLLDLIPLPLILDISPHPSFDSNHVFIDGELAAIQGGADEDLCLGDLRHWAIEDAHHLIKTN